MQPGDARIGRAGCLPPLPRPIVVTAVAQRDHVPAVLDANVRPFHDRSSRLSEQSLMSLRAVTLSRAVSYPLLAHAVWRRRTSPGLARRPDTAASRCGGTCSPRKYTAERAIREEHEMADKPSKGLADVVAASTALSDIDGQAGRPVLPRLRHPPARRVGDLRGDRLPAAARVAAEPRRELDGYRAEIAAGRTLGKLVTRSLAEVAGSQEPMEAMRSLVSLASADDPDKDSNAPEANTRKAARLTAQQPVLVAAYHAARRGT